MKTMAERSGPRPTNGTLYSLTLQWLSFVRGCVGVVFVMPLGCPPGPSFIFITSWPMYM